MKNKFKNFAETDAERFMIALGAMYKFLHFDLETSERNKEPVEQKVIDRFYALGDTYPGAGWQFLPWFYGFLSRRMLRTWWDVTDGPAALEMSAQLIGGLHDVHFRKELELSHRAENAASNWGGTIYAWDVARSIHVLGNAVTAGYLRESDPIWQLLAIGAERAQSLYGSWHEYASSYLAGRDYWNGSNDRDEMTRSCELLLRHPQSPWVTIPWNTKL